MTCHNDLKKVDESLIEPDRLTRFRANAMLGLADVTMQAGDEKGNDGSSGSRALYKQAIDLFRGLHERSPDFVPNQQGLAKSLTEYGDTLAEGGAWQEARRLFFEALELRLQLLAAHSESIDAEREVARLEVLCGEGLAATGERERGREMFEESYQRYGRLRNRDPKSKVIHEGFCRACRELGDWHLAAGNFDEAEARYREFGQWTEALAKEYPLDPDVLMDHSTAYERYGDLSMRRRDTEQAYRDYAESLRLTKRLEAIAPGNTFLQWEVSYSYQHMADVSFSLGKFPEAREAAQQCVDLRRPLVSADPENMMRHVKLLHALGSLARACQRLNDAPAALSCYQEALQTANTFMDVTGTKRFAKQAASYETQIKRLTTATARN